MQKSTLARGEQIETDFYNLKAQEFGPRCTRQQIEEAIKTALKALWDANHA